MPPGRGPSGYDVEDIFKFHDNQVTESRKMLLSKRHTDGLEAPRNSLEVATETSRCYYIVHENIPFSSQVQQQHPIKQHSCRHAGNTMKKLIDREMSNDLSKNRAPSVVARLMGMDAVPSEGKQTGQSNDHRHKSLKNHVPREEIPEKVSTRCKQVADASFKQKKHQLFAFDIKQYDDASSPRPTGPQRREHPQEELLQKFKKEFEAWQSAKARDHPRDVGRLGDDRLTERNNRTHAQDNSEERKRHLSANTERTFHEGSAEWPTYSAAVLRTQKHSLQPEGFMSKEEDPPRLREAMNSKNRMRFIESMQRPELRSNHKQCRFPSPTKIVILKPTPEGTEGNEESWPFSTAGPERDESIEHFLEEVRERLRLEIQGKARNERIQTSICLDEAPFGAKLNDPKQIAQHIAKQIRESVVRDMGKTLPLMRLEPTQSCRGESQTSGPHYPEFINRVTRKHQGERLRNALRNETDVIFGAASLTERTAMSSREEQMVNWEHGTTELLPRNLVRSLSAPVSGKAFGQLLLEHRNLRASVYDRSKHESPEKAVVKVRKMRRINFKGRVSNLRHSLNLRGKLFGRRTQSTNESVRKEMDSKHSVSTSPPPVLSTSRIAQNSTEVPPSPASVSRRYLDELCKPSRSSPVSPLEIPFTEVNPSLEASGEISSSSTLPEEPDHVETVDTAQTLEEVPSWGETPKTEDCNSAAGVKCSNPEEAYPRDVLTIPGLSDKPLEKIRTYWDGEINGIAESAFGEVEQAFTKCETQLAGTRRKILFDVFNEVLLHVLGSPLPSSALKRHLAPGRALHGKALLEDVQGRVQTQLHPPVDRSCSLELLVGCDMKTTTSWSTMLDEGLDAVGGELEGMIFLDLVDELVSDVWR